MNCPKCGTLITEGQRFCPNCGTPAAAPQSQPAQNQPVQNTQGAYSQPNYSQTAPGGYAQQPYTQQTYNQQAYAQPAPKKKKTGLIILIIVLAVLLVLGIGIALLVSLFKYLDRRSAEIDYEPDFDYETDADIDLDSLDDAISALDDLNLDTDLDIDFDDQDLPDFTTDDEIDETDLNDDDSSDLPSGDKTVYSYTDVYRDGNDITVIPNGGLNAFTELYGGKDLDGFLDYVDSTVLEEGRTINREFFYEILAIMLVDENMSSDIDSIEKNMIMALAMANNFHDTDVTIRQCYLNANNAAEYRYKVNAYGKDDIWVVNYGKRTIYFNDGKTEYSSDLFRDDYLALWMVAIEEYYGIS